MISEVALGLAKPNMFFDSRPDKSASVSNEFTLFISPSAQSKSLTINAASAFTKDIAFLV